MKTQVVMVGGGEAFDTHDEYIEWLKNPDFDPFGYLDETEPGEDRWSRVLGDNLGDGYEVIKIQMPNSMNAKYDEWVIWLQHFLRHAQDGCVLIGHSLGANFWAKYLSEHEYPKNIRSLHLVSGCYGWKGDYAIEKDLSLLSGQVGSIHIYHSVDDEVVSYEDAEKYKATLAEATLHRFEGKGHFLEEKVFPELIENIKK